MTRKARHGVERVEKLRIRRPICRPRVSARGPGVGVVYVMRVGVVRPTAHVGGRIAGFNMAGVDKEYVWGTGMNSVDFFGFPVISAGFINPPEGQDMEVLIKSDPDMMIYKKFLIKDNRIVGMIFVNEVDRAGVILGLMRDKADITPFKSEILLEDFGLIYLPNALRQEPSAKEARS